MVRLLVESGVSKIASGGNAHKMVMLAHTHHKTAQQSRGGMMDRDSKTEGGASSKPASM